ncbi:MAG: glycosyltransferase [Bacteroidota bacterium]|nr:glycosyltransferase [Bacteroidota bacterium]
MIVSPDIDYSIIICTYNPDDRILKRCLESVYQLDTKDFETEVILVDNNSLIPVESLPYVKEYGEKIPFMKVLRVKKQGVKYARMAAIAEAKGKYIVYIDYDNEPEKDYLLELKKLHIQFPQVAAWGPGDVAVDFIDGIDDEIENYARIAFQERHDEKVCIARETQWQPCYPFGTGLCTFSFLLKEYVRLAKQGKFTMHGRRGNKLSSGEDTQMVLLCISKDYFAGVSPTLKLKHIIPKTRANYQYLKRLAYGTALSYDTCYVQVFPQNKNELQQKIISGAKFSRRIIKKYLNAKMHFKSEKIFELANYTGQHAGVYLALKRPLPVFIKRFIKYLKLE